MNKRFYFLESLSDNSFKLRSDILYKKMHKNSKNAHEIPVPARMMSPARMAWSDGGWRTAWPGGHEKTQKNTFVIFVGNK